MLPRTYEDQNCSIARALEVLGDRWTILVMREAFMRVRRFDDFQRNLGVARNVLTDRLGRLVDEGILERVPYQERPARFEYRLTEKGLDLWPIMMALLQWGDRHYPAEAGPPARHPPSRLRRRGHAPPDVREVRRRARPARRRRRARPGRARSA